MSSERAGVHTGGTLNREALVRYLFEGNESRPLTDELEGSRELDEARDEADTIIRVLTSE